MSAKEYPVQVLIYVTQEQFDALHDMTNNVSAWVRSKIDREIRRTQTQEQRRAAKTSEVAK